MSFSVKIPLCRRVLWAGLVIVATLALAACTAGPASLQATSGAAATQVFESALLTATYAVQVPATATPPPPTAAPTASPTPDLQRTPPALPPVYISSLLKPVDVPHTYIEDQCEYLKLRWDPNNSVPGTVVMPIMFHSVTDGEATLEYQISHDTLVQLLRDLKEQGFESINSQQLADFLERNAKIPPRSVLLIVDDRHNPEYFIKHFKPQLDEYGWTVTNAFIAHPNTSEELWRGNAELSASGLVDYQAHGVVHNIPISNFAPNTILNTEVYGAISAEEFIRNELSGPRPIFQERFGKQPIAYIWPGGGFSKPAVETARQVGYRLGFTINPRGPIMFNWVPLADQGDPNRPNFLPEGPMQDPLMVLPRYWDKDAEWRMDEVRIIGKEAAAYAAQNRQIELEYYDIVCKKFSGEIPTQITGQ